MCWRRVAVGQRCEVSREKRTSFRRILVFALADNLKSTTETGAVTVTEADFTFCGCFRPDEYFRLALGGSFPVQLEFVTSLQVLHLNFFFPLQNFCRM